MFAAAMTAFLQLHAADPLGPAWEGLAQCYKPDEARKTCRALAGYRRSGDGQIINDAEVLLMESDPEMIILSSAPVFVRDGMVCGSGKFTVAELHTAIVDGVTITSKNDTTGLLDEIVRILHAFAPGQEVCTLYEEVDDGRFKRVVFYDGKRSADDGNVVIWVRREDGWRVAP